MRKQKRERIEKGSRERTEKERKTKKGNGSLENYLKGRRRNITTGLCLLFSFFKTLQYSFEDMSS